MSLNDLIGAGEASEAGSATFWKRGKPSELKIYDKRPILSAEAVTCHLTRQEIAEVAVELIDPNRIARFKVRLRGAVRIREGGERNLIRARENHGGIDLAVCEAVRSALNTWRTSPNFIAELFPAGQSEASADAVINVIEALQAIGLDVDAARIEPLGWNPDKRIAFEFGPRRLQSSDAGGALSVTVTGELVDDPAQMAAFLTATEGSAGKASIKDAAEAHTFQWLEGRYSRHQQVYEAHVIAVALRAELDRFCGLRFGRKLAQLRYENTVSKTSAPEPQSFEFEADYKIAASNADLLMTHRGTVIVTDAGRAPGGLPQHRRDLQERISATIQSRILSFSANKVNAELYTFEGENANALSRWTMENETLRSELAARGLKLGSLYVFTNDAPSEPVSLGRNCTHVKNYSISGTKRVLTLEHRLLWHVGSTREQQSDYVRKGSLAPEALEKKLGEKLDEQVSKRLLNQTFDAVIFDYFSNQKVKERELTEALQKELSAFSADYGVEVDTMTTVFTLLPEAKLLTSHTVIVPSAEYALADAKDKIELGAKVTMRFAQKSDGALLRGHLMGPDPQEIFAIIEKGIAEQIGILLSRVEPWEIFAMRHQHEGGERGAGLPLIARVDAGVSKWLLATFGLEIVKPEGFALPIGKCELIDTAERLIGDEQRVVISAMAPLERINSDYATDMRIEVEVTIPFRIDGVGPKPEDRRRFMEALRAMRGAEQILAKIHEIIGETVRGLVQQMPAGAFNSQNFAKYPFAEGFAAAVIDEVYNSTGLIIYVSRQRLLPDVKGALVSNDIIRQRNILAALEDQCAKADSEPDDYYDEGLVKRLKKRIRDKRSEIEKLVKQHRVGGELDTKTAGLALTSIKDYLRRHKIKSTLLLDDQSGDDAANGGGTAGNGSGASNPRNEDITDAEFKEVGGPASPADSADGAGTAQ